MTLIEQLQQGAFYDLTSTGLAHCGKKAAEALKALNGFARHHHLCQQGMTLHDRKCVCGLTKLREEIGL